jgi:hypothetical protein
MYERIRQILDSARSSVARSVNTTQVIANWLIGREIIEEEQKGISRAGYGEELILDLSARLTSDYGKGYSKDNLFWFRRFYQGYPKLVDLKFDAVRQISDAPPRKSMTQTPGDALPPILHAPRGESWSPGFLHPNLSWTHYRTLLRVDKAEARAFYEIEALKNNWAARELERQICSLLYERLALSKDKKGLMRLAVKGHEVQKPNDVFKDPVVMEFLGLPESPKLVETDLEQALIDNLQSLGADQIKTIFASRYKLHLPSEAELRAELRREVRMLSAPTKMGRAK